ncbi:YceI family protein [Psychroserpens ponticola]|uniref:YceI family protein n=1 Tax=Psychroserpens ponticola TaxID=2932268 RepID=A0ABY7RUV5_9FLAO|nr:YceI family protein [Psychroserpens ponticola]WCO00911.1 YceI family protein [Psychroserpens ponticola]
MKNNILKTGFIVILAMTIASFTTASEKSVNVKDSSITWKGHKVTGSHEGTINLLEGSLIFDGENLTAGQFTIDMTSIIVTDLEAGSGKEKLEGHLKSDDFFGVNNHKKAMFKINSVNGKNGTYRVYGDLTIKGITKPATFQMMIKGNTATASFKIDRTKYNIKYGSSSFFDNLKDKAIYDDFDLNVTLKF